MPPLLAPSKQKESCKINCKTIYKNHLQKKKKKKKGNLQMNLKKKKKKNPSFSYSQHEE
jgi:hypothetical protein